MGAFTMRFGARICPKEGHQRASMLLRRKATYERCQKLGYAVINQTEIVEMLQCCKGQATSPD